MNECLNAQLQTFDARARRVGTALVVGVAIVMGGCGGAHYGGHSGEAYEDDYHGEHGGAIQTAAGVTVIEVTCDPNAPEICDGLDNNCNGQIDEGCGYSSGQIQITLAWNTGADIDLYVTDPYNETINYGSRTSRSGGQLDVDARGACNSNDYRTVENVFWNTPQPPAGNYKVEAHYWAENTCSTNAGPTPITLSIAVGGRVIGSYNYVLHPNDRIAVATFQL